jgi:hypothetical protein
MVKNYRILLFILLIAWFLVNLLQATCTEVISDEAYYGLYGKYLAWGYFDHPPMVGLMTRISSLFFSGNLGIRFLTVILQPLTLLFIWNTVDNYHPDFDKVYSLFIIAGSICLFAVFGFFTTPDVPLLFFTAFFLYSYKRFLASDSWKNVSLLSLSMAGLVYSKYHAVLIIGFVIISNLRLLKSYRFWMAGLSALILITPHLWWQAANNYPSLKFQLIERSEGFKWINVIEYLPNQMAVFNPFVLGAVVYIMVKNKPEDLFTRALYFLIAGFIVFFGLTSFHDHVEPQWTVSCSIAMIILIFNASTVDPGMFRFIRRALLPVVILLFIARILLVANIPPGRYFGFNGKNAKYKFIESVAKDLPVLFTGSFQDPSLYSFFTGKAGIGISTLHSRKTEYDIWQLEKEFNNKPVFVYGFSEGRSSLYEKEGMKFYGYVTDSLQTVNRIGIAIMPKLKVISPGDSLHLDVILKNPYPYDIDFNHRKFPVSIDMALLGGNKTELFPVILHEPVGILRSGESIARRVTVIIPELPEGSYKFGICLRTVIGPSINDSFSMIKIMKR